ncbi:TetR/AcrR family transcriptional regulator [Amycolatopsis cihanbeyliensis]|uniref:TetR family transcriptional regulator n=1 Tax=Amycolatopsis cihanbeyliensis TaxID=1128664 RepID=A0A542CUP8_AMYCI|nr:TetR/AcrR family transcriptional regulator [Amycolatopsis cihanbeyliensis]TQI94545.1 TetR family transcriptional regulator [Amycolatopsis cihanbeyliensis]
MARSKGSKEDPSARERILVAAEELFARSGFEATPTSRIAERAGVPKGLVHYYFRRKSDLLTALVERLPDERIEPARVVVPGDIAESLRRLVDELDRRLSASRMLSHLLWREADTHRAVRDALQARFTVLVHQVRSVITAAGAGGIALADVESASGLLARAVSYRHSVARHGADDEPDPMERELAFIAAALSGRGKARGEAPA